MVGVSRDQEPPLSDSDPHAWLEELPTPQLEWMIRREGRPLNLSQVERVQQLLREREKPSIQQGLLRRLFGAIRLH